jgi:flagellin-like protein
MRKMSIKRMLTSKKAISPILATLLLIVIAVAAIVITYAWITTYMGTTTGQASVLLKTENIRWTTSSTVITVLNSGTGDTRIVRVYVGDSAENMTEVTFTGTVALNAGSTTTLTIAWPNALATAYTDGSTYYFRIVPNPGQFLEFQDQAPQ